MAEVRNVQRIILQAGLQQQSPSVPVHRYIFQFIRLLNLQELANGKA
jgi:hypothetical protein